MGPCPVATRRRRPRRGRQARPRLATPRDARARGRTPSPQRGPEPRPWSRATPCAPAPRRGR
eukprot:8857603-Lingulodinium_polyedra.AAC.1